jgi:hypothetical protein
MNPDQNSISRRTLVTRLGAGITGAAIAAACQRRANPPIATPPLHSLTLPRNTRSHHIQARRSPGQVWPVR